METERPVFGKSFSVSESQRPISCFQSDPVKPGPIGLHYTIFDHRGIRVPIANVSWAERLAHAPSASRFLPKFSLSFSTIGLLVLVVTGTFAMQEAASRLAITFSPNSAASKTAIQLFGLFGPLLFVLLLIFGGVVFSASRIWIPAVARHWLSIGQCASCRYDLTNAEPAMDECLVCPECGAAWKLRRAQVSG
ncbi:MAG: hypothetical protein JSR52_05100 [Planctomycetes bacterium]|nr:hypothetical protein [Planctomycetota bacterium]